MSTHTPGPWTWSGNASTNNIRITSLARGRFTVMDFSRWGMSDAQPRFRDDGRMVDGKHLLKFEVGNSNVIGVDAARLDSGVYRLDIVDIDHPDALLLIAASDLLEALKRCLNYIENTEGGLGIRLECGDAARGALKKAEDGL